MIEADRVCPIQEKRKREDKCFLSELEKKWRRRGKSNRHPPPLSSGERKKKKKKEKGKEEGEKKKKLYGESRLTYQGKGEREGGGGKGVRSKPCITPLTGKKEKGTLALFPERRGGEGTGESGGRKMG